MDDAPAGFEVRYRPTRNDPWFVIGVAATYTEAVKISCDHKGSGHYWITPAPQKGVR